MAQHAQGEGCGIDCSEGYKAYAGGWKQYPECGCCGEDIDRCQSELDQNDVHTGRREFNGAEPQRRPPHRAKKREKPSPMSEWSPQPTAMVRAERPATPHFARPQDETDRGDRREPDAEGDRDKEYDACYLTRGKPGSGIKPVADRTARKGSEADRVTDRETAKRGEEHNFKRRAGAA